MICPKCNIEDKYGCDCIQEETVKGETMKIKFTSNYVGAVLMLWCSLLGSIMGNLGMAVGFMNALILIAILDLNEKQIYGEFKPERNRPDIQISDDLIDRLSGKDDLSERAGRNMCLECQDNYEKSGHLRPIFNKNKQN